MLGRISSFLLLFFISLSVSATHIVGGEFSLLWKGRGDNYQLEFNMYFDDINAASMDLIEKGIIAYVFEKGTNRLVDQIPLPLISSDKFVQYKVPKCVQNNLRTRILQYQKDVFLDPSLYTNPQGYYINFETCCRNAIINNIIRPDETGSAFLMEFPAVVKNGVTFRNSTPKFKSIEGEYFCLNEYQQFDFGAVDANKDSLVYSLVTPLKGNYGPDANLTPQPNPEPYPLVNWVRGYSVDNMITGNPPLQINPHTGMITVRPDKKGLFVMSVKVEEYRNGVKIGETRRDFQYKVVDCPFNYRPYVTLVDDAGSQFKSTDTITIPYSEQKCYNAILVDTSAYIENEPVQLALSTDPLAAKVFSVTPTSVVLTRSAPILSSKICLNNCGTINLQKDSLFQLAVIASDNSCPVPLKDTFNINVLIKGIPSNPPKVKIGDDITSFVAIVGDTISFPVYGTDPDSLDQLTLTLNSEKLPGMRFDNATGKERVSSNFSWVVDCESLKKKSLRVSFKLQDESCVPSRTDTTSARIDIVDKETTITEISPTNLITPNGDQLNDNFYILNIPEGNCTSFFANIEIYNRWGGIIFKSEDPNFRWTAEGVPDGLYFYFIDLQSKKIKGWIQVIR